MIEISSIIKKKDKKKDKNIEKSSSSNFLIQSVIKTPQKKMNVETDVQLVAIYKSITQNYIFYIVLLCCLVAFTKYTTHNRSCFILSLCSIVFVTFYGYMVHLLSHYMQTNVSNLYKTYSNIFTRNKYINWMALKMLDFGEFHAKTHHNSDINKQFTNIALEFINNAVTQGIILIVIKYILGLIDNRVIVLWALFYATVHNINYLVVKPSTHTEHHIDSKTNYGIDIWDIIIGSKYDWNNIETHNHTAINLIVITAVIIFICNRFKF